MHGFDLNNQPVPRKSGSYYNSLVFNCSGGGDGLESAFLLYDGDGDGHYHCINNVRWFLSIQYLHEETIMGFHHKKELDIYTYILKV